MTEEVQAVQPQEEESPLDMVAALAAQQAAEQAEVQPMHEAVAGIVDQVDAEVNPETPLDEFLDNGEEEVDYGPSIYITSSATGRMVLPVDGDHTFNNVPGYSIRELLDEANLTVRPGSTQFWVEGNQVEIDFIVPIGATVTVIGPVKGG